MSQKFNPQDHYFKQAKKDGFVARSAYKLEEIDNKFHFFWPKVRTVIDIGCAPGSWLQYVSRKLSGANSRSTTGREEAKIIGFDLKKVTERYPNVVTYQQDITEQEKVKWIVNDLLRNTAEWKLWVMNCDIIISDMAPDTLWHSATDALRSISLIYDTMWMYHELLKPDGKFAIKVFMGPGFEELVQYCREHRGTQHIKIFKPKACRDISKETYIVKI